MHPVGGGMADHQNRIKSHISCQIHFLHHANEHGAIQTAFCIYLPDVSVMHGVSLSVSQRAVFVEYTRRPPAAAHGNWRAAMTG
jgi:hypothetical protein